jgi:hypothetical protein
MEIVSVARNAGNMDGYVLEQHGTTYGWHISERLSHNCDRGTKDQELW